jgi:tryptophan halogenase
MIKSLCILGGGTAGLIAALMARSSYPKLSITVVESSEYGIVGVGEGSTEHWAGFMQHIDVDVPTLVRETAATYKTGIRFTNWHGDGTEYWHNLFEDLSHQDQKVGLYTGMIKLIADNVDPVDTVLPTGRKSLHAQPLHYSVHQYHFDTNKLNVFMHKLCSERNITVIDDKINDVTLDSQGNVHKLIGEKDFYTADFFIDSSGFRRVISSKLNVKWNSCADQLPMNSALAAPTPYEEEIPSHTEARALSSGWMWRIPTQDRFGNGYVYCDKFISDEDAEAEFKSQFPYEITVAKKIKFEAGYLDELWVKNCLNVGLAGMFVEPLEATSIGFTIQQMFGFLISLPNYSSKNTLARSTYNDTFKIVAQNIIDFVQLHYFTERKDSEFWKWCNNGGITKSEFNKTHLDNFKKTLPGQYAFQDKFLMFKELNWLQVMHGLRLYDYKTLNEWFYDNLTHTIPFIEEQLREREFVTSSIQYFPHREALRHLTELTETMLMRDIKDLIST